MNTKLDYLLSCISEECGEIVQVVGKADRFGILDIDPNLKQTNWVKLRKEIHDLITVYEMFCDEFDRNPKFDQKLIMKKKKRVLKFMKYSKEVGRLINN